MQVNTKPILIYPGSKRRFVKELYPVIKPKNKKTPIYSLFFGGGEFEIALANMGYTVYASDMYRELVDFWWSVQHKKKKLIKIIQQALPMNREKFYTMLEHFRSFDQVRRGASFYILNRCSFSGNGHNFSKVMCDRFNNINGHVKRIENFTWPKTLHLTESDYKDVFPPRNSIVFMDPPYKIGKKNITSCNSFYGYRGKLHNGFNHKEFVNYVQHLKSNRWYITTNEESGYPFNTIKQLQTIARFNTLTNKRNGREIIMSNCFIN
jgi:site-specific DNA-adenine methylase